MSWWYLMSTRKLLFLCCTRVVRKIISNWSQLMSRTCWSTVLWPSWSYFYSSFISNWGLPHWCSSVQSLYRKQKRHRGCCFLLFMIYVQLVKQEKLKFPLHYANAQLQLDGGLYHCKLIYFYSGLCPVVMRRRKWRCTFVWGLPEEPLDSEYDIVCAYSISCVYRIVTYVRDPDQIRGSHSTKLF